MSTQRNPLIDSLINPVRIRIIGYCLAHAPCTAKQIGADLPDVPQASLYRHIRHLLTQGILEVDHETQVRGTVERSYRLSHKAPAVGEPSDRELLDAFYTFMLTLFSDLEGYLRRGEADPIRDQISFTTGFYNLSDEEFGEMMGEIGETVGRYVGNVKTPARKLRRISWIVSPTDMDGNPPEPGGTEK